jgi:hypothetical protein
MWMICRGVGATRPGADPAARDIRGSTIAEPAPIKPSCVKNLRRVSLMLAVSLGRKSAFSKPRK